MAIPLLVMAGIAAAAAAAQGIAGAAQAKAGADQQAGESAKDRALREKLTKAQLAEQQRQFQLQQQAAAQQSLMGSMQQGADLQVNRAGERAATREDMRAALARAYLGG